MIHNQKKKMVEYTHSHINISRRILKFHSGMMFDFFNFVFSLLLLLSPSFQDDSRFWNLFFFFVFSFSLFDSILDDRNGRQEKEWEKERDQNVWCWHQDTSQSDVNYVLFFFFSLEQRTEIQNGKKIRYTNRIHMGIRLFYFILFFCRLCFNLICHCYCYFHFFFSLDFLLNSVRILFWTKLT